MEHYREGRIQEAIEAWSEQVSHQRDNWVAWYYLGLSYRQIGQEGEACRMLALVAGMCPDPRLSLAAYRALPTADGDSYGAAFDNKDAAAS